MMNFTNTLKAFPRTFWIANSMELFERWAYYGMFAVLSVYLTDPVSKGGLGFSQEQRGVMQAVVTGILYLLPIAGGAIADRFGFRKVLLAAFVTLASGYFAMGQFHAYAPVFISFLVVAGGGAIFKPVIVATVSKTTAKGSDTLGFGIFYMIVNIGGFIGPWAASKMRDINWQYVFIMCSAVILVNLILLLFYREPAKEEKSKEPFLKSMERIISNTITVFKDLKFVLFLVIIIGFWAMYMQLFFIVPIYIGQWVDTSIIYSKIGILTAAFGSIEDGRGLIRPEMMINIPAFTIILFQVMMSNFLSKVKPIRSMIVGILVVCLAYFQFNFYINGWFIALALMILAFGEMASSPRIQEYISRIAPKEKVALYMGYSFLPLAGGNIFGALLSGELYGSLSDKYYFLRQYLVDKGHNSMEEIASLDDGILFKESLTKLNMEADQLTGILYDTYHPGSIWLIFASIGLGTAILLFIYNKFVLKD